MRVAVLANLKENAPTWEGMSPDQWDDLDSEARSQSICAALAEQGHAAEFLEGDATLLDTVRAYQAGHLLQPLRRALRRRT